MKLRELTLGDILIINGVPNIRKERFRCEDSDGNTYYHFPDTSPFIRFLGWEEIEHFSGNTYILITTIAGEYDFL